ncbi:hypothetical protein AB1Y20_019119 [Prymnesium parvum]|uniref:Rab3 GTPase-activating protein catalytic subunit n=1 Tax=Prymnesium parvum TaxID=97485 RepID=A0AB34JQI8_PRYPA
MPPVSVAAQLLGVGDRHRGDARLELIRTAALLIGRQKLHSAAREETPPASVVNSPHADEMFRVLCGLRGTKLSAAFRTWLITLACLDRDEVYTALWEAEATVSSLRRELAQSHAGNAANQHVGASLSSTMDPAQLAAASSSVSPLRQEATVASDEHSPHINMILGEPVVFGECVDAYSEQVPEMLASALGPLGTRNLFAPEPAGLEPEAYHGRPDEEAIRPMWTEESGLACRIMKMESLDRKNAAAEGVCMMPPTIGHQNTVRLNEHIEELELQVGIRARASFLSSGLHTDHRD